MIFFPVIHPLTLLLLVCCLLWCFLAICLDLRIYNRGFVISFESLGFDLTWLANLFRLSLNPWMLKDTWLRQHIEERWLKLVKLRIEALAKLQLGLLLDLSNLIFYLQKRWDYVKCFCSQLGQSVLHQLQVALVLLPTVLNLGRGLALQVALVVLHALHQVLLHLLVWQELQAILLVNARQNLLLIVVIR